MKSVPVAPYHQYSVGCVEGAFSCSPSIWKMGNGSKEIHISTCGSGCRADPAFVGPWRRNTEACRPSFLPSFAELTSSRMTYAWQVHRRRRNDKQRPSGSPGRFQALQYQQLLITECYVDKMLLVSSEFPQSGRWHGPKRSPCLSQRTRTTSLTTWHTGNHRARLTFAAHRRQLDPVLKGTQQHRYLSPPLFAFRKTHQQVAFDTYLKYRLPPPLHKCNRTIYFLDWRRAFHVGSAYVTLIRWPIKMQHNLLTWTNQKFAQVTVFTSYNNKL